MSIKTKRKDYFAPVLQVVELDQEISLALESDANPEGEPDWLGSNENFDTDPYKILS